MVKYLNIISVVSFLFVSCNNSMGEVVIPYVELEWITIESTYNNGSSVPYTTYRYYDGQHIDMPEVVVEYDYKCNWIHYYKDGNYFNFGKSSNTSSDVETVDLDRFTNIEYQEK